MSKKSDNVSLIAKAINKIIVRERSGEKVKTTPEDLKCYTAHLLYWLAKLGKQDFCHQFSIVNIDSDAMVDINPSDRHAFFQLAEMRDGDLSIAYLAQHEAFECLMGDVSTNLETIYSKDYVKELTHNVIHRLQFMIPPATDKEVGYTPRKK